MERNQLVFRTVEKTFRILKPKNPARCKGKPGGRKNSDYFEEVIGADGAERGAVSGQHEAARNEAAAARTRNLMIFMMLLLLVG